MRVKKFQDKNGDPIVVMLLDCKARAMVNFFYSDGEGDKEYSFPYVRDESGRNIAKNFFYGLTEESTLRCVDFLKKKASREEE